MEIEDRIVFGAEDPEAEQLHVKVKGRPDHHAEDQAIDAEVGRQKPGAGDDGEVVEHRRQGRQQEVLVRIQNPHDDPADAKDHGADQHQAHQRNGQLLLSGAKAGGENVADQQRGDDACQDRQGRHQQEHEVDDGAEEPPTPTVIAAGHEAGEHRDECRAERSAGHQLKEQIGHPESGQVSVKIAARAKAGANDHLACKPGEPTDHKKRDDESGRPRRSVRILERARGRVVITRGDYNTPARHGERVEWGAMSRE